MRFFATTCLNRRNEVCLAMVIRPRPGITKGGKGENRAITQSVMATLCLLSKRASSGGHAARRFWAHLGLNYIPWRACSQMIPNFCVNYSFTGSALRPMPE